MNVSELRRFATRHLSRLLAEAPTAKTPARLGQAKPAGLTGAPTRPAPQPSMSQDHWGTILEVGQARVGDRFVLGRLRFRTDDGLETTFLVERGHTYLCFSWLDDRGVWQRKRAAFHELKPGMRAEVEGESGVAENVFIEGLPRVSA